MFVLPWFNWTLAFFLATVPDPHSLFITIVRKNNLAGYSLNHEVRPIVESGWLKMISLFSSLTFEYPRGRHYFLSSVLTTFFCHLQFVQDEFYSVCHTKKQYEEFGPGICRHNPVFGTMTWESRLPQLSHRQAQLTAHAPFLVQWCIWIFYILFHSPRLRTTDNSSSLFHYQKPAKQISLSIFFYSFVCAWLVCLVCLLSVLCRHHGFYGFHCYRLRRPLCSRYRWPPVSHYSSAFSFPLCVFSNLFEAHAQMGSCDSCGYLPTVLPFLLTISIWTCSNYDHNNSASET